MTVSTPGLEQFERDLKIRSGEAAKPIDRCLTKWAARMRGFLKARFSSLSKGGGAWPPLAVSTLRQRRTGKRKGGSSAILRDTGTLMGALSPSADLQPGAIEIHEGLTVTVGYGGGDKHPSSRYATIAEIASFHQDGNPRLPKREIVVQPDQETLTGMGHDLYAAALELAKMRIEEGK